LQKIQSQTVIREKLCKIFLYEKAAPKMFVKLTPGVNFTNLLAQGANPHIFPAWQVFPLSRIVLKFN